MSCSPRPIRISSAGTLARKSCTEVKTELFRVNTTSGGRRIRIIEILLRVAIEMMKIVMAMNVAPTRPSDVVTLSRVAFRSDSEEAALSARSQKYFLPP